MDNYVVLARKYRPSSFQTVVGQQAITQSLQNAIRTNHLAQAYLFCGPRGVGKTTCARIFAKTINCLAPTAENDACNSCESCTAFNEQRSFNIHELDAASNNSVDDIRKLIEQVRIPPQLGRYSVYIIDEVHMLSKDAFNALLKTLEEPPSYAIFILATTEKHKVLPTILSRCQVFDFSRITIADTIQYLRDVVCTEEGIQTTEDVLNVVAQKADGAMRDALSIFDQLIGYCGKKISYEQTIEILNVLSSEYYFRLVDCALAGNVSGALLLFNEVLEKGFDAQNFIVGFCQHLRDVLVSKDAQTTILLETSESIRQHYAEQAARCSLPFLFKGLELSNKCDIDYRMAKNKRLTVEVMLIKICQLVAPVEQTQDAAVKMQDIRPQAPTRPAQPAAPQPTPQPVQRPVQQATPQPAPRPQQPTVPRMNAPRMVSINANRNAQAAAPENAEKKEDPVAAKRSNPFTHEDLDRAWLTLPAIFTKEDRLKATLMNAPLKRIESNKVQLSLANKLQEEEVLAHRVAIVTELRNRLQNDEVEIVTLIDTSLVHQVLTPQQRYEALAKTNPELNNFVQALGLTMQ